MYKIFFLIFIERNKQIETNKHLKNMKRIILITIASILLTSCSAEKIANYKGFPWLGSPSLNIQHVQIDGHYYIIETNTSTGSTKVTTVR